MNKKLFIAFIYMILALALLGLISTFFTSPSTFVWNTLGFIILTSLVFGLIYFIIYRRSSNHNELKKYREAVKQSKKRQNRKNELYINSHHKKVSRFPVTKTRKASHLRVIDGKKSTKKDPISYG